MIHKSEQSRSQCRSHGGFGRYAGEINGDRNRGVEERGNNRVFRLTLTGVRVMVVSGGGAVPVTGRTGVSRFAPRSISASQPLRNRGGVNHCRGV